MKIKNLVFGLALIMSAKSLKAQVKTFDLTAEIQAAQTTFGQVKDYPILIFNQDEIDQLFLKARAFGADDDKEAKARRIQVIQDYVKAKIDLDISGQEADQYEPYLTKLKGSAVALPLLNSGFGRKSYRMCAVFHASPNSNQRLEFERILGLKTPGAYENSAFESIKPQLPYETLAKFSLYHEIGHCLDSHFLPSTYSGGEDPHSVHKSESFAEVMGLFLLTKEGYSNIARTRGLLRTIYSRQMGRFFTQNPRYGFGNPFYLAGGVIYYLEPALRGGDEVIQRYRGEFKNLELEELMDLAANVVHENALNSRSFHAILNYLKEINPETAIERYREYSYSSPDLFYRAYSDLIVYRDYTDYILSKVFNPEAIEGTGTGELAALDLNELCTLSITGQTEALSERVSSYRQELQQGIGSPSAQRERALELNELFENELSSCHHSIH